MIASTNDDIADDPDHSEITNPIETTSARALVRMSATVGAMMSSTASRLNTRPTRSTTCSWTAVTVSGPYRSPT